MLFLFPTLFVLVLLSLYWYGTRNYKYWKEQNIPILSTPIPFFGNFFSVTTLRDTLPTFGLKVYKNAKSSMVGFYMLRTPGLVVCEPELIKSVLHSNFGSFRSNYFSPHEGRDPVLLEHPLFAVKHDDWKDKRSHITQLVTGAKNKLTFPVIKNVCSKMEEFLDRHMEKNGGFYECELKIFFLRYAGEIIANNAFGMEGQCFYDNPDPSSFQGIMGPLFIPNTAFGWRLMMYQFLPTFAEYLGGRFMTKEMEVFCFQQLEARVKERKETNGPYDDFLQHCMQSSIGGNSRLVVGNMLNFLLDTYELPSTSLANLAYLLSQHPEIQEKARNEVISKLNGGPVSYESLKEMTYLEQVVMESFRHTIPAGFFFRVCTEETILTGTDGLKCKVKPGFRILVPAMGVHSDDKHWPNPEIFDPERFSPENRAKLNKYTFLPFGEGPRKCPGEKLGMVIVKAAAATLLSKYSIEHSTVTQTPLELDTIAIATYFKGGVWAKFKKLDQ